MQGVDQGLCLVEADGVGREGVEDAGEGLVDRLRTIDLGDHFRVQVGVAGALFAWFWHAAGMVEVAVIFAAEGWASALVAVGHDAVAKGDHLVVFLLGLLHPQGWGVSKSLKIRVQDWEAP